jgi:hypothetical protein
VNEIQFFKPSSNERYSCDLRYSWDRRTFADGYYLAAKQLVHQVSEQCSLSDSYGPPIAFLFRHYMELMLKDIRHLQARISGSAPSEKPTHKLNTLWDEVKMNTDKDFIDRYNGVLDYREEIHPYCETEECIKEYTRMDPSGDAFRYPEPIENHKKSALSAEIRLQRTFDVVHLGQKMEAVEYFLNVLRGYLMHKIGGEESHL